MDGEFIITSKQNPDLKPCDDRDGHHWYWNDVTDDIECFTCGQAKEITVTIFEPSPKSTGEADGTQI